VESRLLISFQIFASKTMQEMSAWGVVQPKQPNSGGRLCMREDGEDLADATDKVVRYFRVFG
jgi:hypothetical protein